MPTSGNADPTRSSALVWDVAVRLHHWMLAALVIFCSIQDDGGQVHRAAGYAAAGVVVTRLLWAVLAKGHGSLAALKPSATATLAYVRARAPRCIGHDPLGLWMVWLLWSLVLLLGLTGWMSRLDTFWGDERLQDIHAWLADALLAAVALHLLGVGVMSWRWRENLSASMMTGRKRGFEGSSDRATRSRSVEQEFVSHAKNVATERRANADDIVGFTDTLPKRESSWPVRKNEGYQCADDEASARGILRQ